MEARTGRLALLDDVLVQRRGATMANESTTTRANGSGYTVSRRTVLAGAGAIGASALLGGSRAHSQGSVRIVVYSTTHPAIQTNLTQAFTNKTGIAVQSLRLNTAAL